MADEAEEETIIVSQLIRPRDKDLAMSIAFWKSEKC